MTQQGQKILITGGAGFLGSHLCRRLLDEGGHVICVDNFQTGQQVNIDPLMDNPRFELITHDIEQPLQGPQVAGLTQIYNLACPASPVHYQTDPVKTTRTNVMGALNMLELARANGARIFQASTSEVYGDPLEHPQTEDYRGNVNPHGPRACYDEGKRCAESLFFDYHRQYGLEIKVVRIFNTYGPLMHPEDGRVVSNFVIQALKGEDLTVYGDGSQTRSFCYVDDLVEGFFRLMNSPADITGPVNMGNPGEFTVKELADKVLALVGSGSGVDYRPLPQDDPAKRRPDITLAKKLLDWEPKISLDEGLKKTADHFRAMQEAGRL